MDLLSLNATNKPQAEDVHFGVTAPNRRHANTVAICGSSPEVWTGRVNLGCRHTSSAGSG